MLTPHGTGPLLYRYSSTSPPPSPSLSPVCAFGGSTWNAHIADTIAEFATIADLRSTGRHPVRWCCGTHTHSHCCWLTCTLQCTSERPCCHHDISTLSRKAFASAAAVTAAWCSPADHSTLLACSWISRSKHKLTAKALRDADSAAPQHSITSRIVSIVCPFNNLLELLAVPPAAGLELQPTSNHHLLCGMQVAAATPRRHIITQHLRPVQHQE